MISAPRSTGSEPEAEPNLADFAHAEMIRKLRASTRLFELTSPSARVEAEADEHFAILDVYGAGDATRTRAAMVTHLRNVAAEILDIVGGR